MASGLLALVVLAGTTFVQKPSAQDVLQQDVVRPYVGVLDSLDTQVRNFASNMKHAHAALIEQVRRRAPKLLERLSPEPPKPRPSGYGLLPPIFDDLAFEDVELTETRYSIEEVTTAFTADLSDATALAKKGPGTPADLRAQVDHYNFLKGRMQFLEELIAYHRYWQSAVERHTDFFEEKNRLVAKVRRMKALLEAGGDVEDVATLRDEIRKEAAPFSPTPGLAMERRGGLWVLPVTVVTDIGDEEFLKRFAAAVRTAFSQAEVARRMGFRLELTLRKVAAASFYDGNPPRRGAAIDESEHFKKFPDGALVLTTGGETTHAFIGKYVQLGSQPVRPRELAHEFGHLLGFNDAYLRGHEGRPGDAFGCVLVEWSGLLDDIMGSPSRGRVSSAMIRSLIEAYGVD